MSESNIFLHTYNPGNIRFSESNEWLGQIGKYKGFVCFASCAYGVRALIILLKNYISKGFDTPSKIINRFAPSSENDTDSYISFIHQKFIDKDLKISCPSELFALVAGICRFETGYILPRNVFDYVFKRFKLHFFD